MKKILFKALCLFVAGVFSFELMCDPQMAQAQVTNLPAASAALSLSAEYTPLMVRGMKINPQDGLDLSFIVDTGNTDLSEETLEKESEKLIKYFLTALAVPEKDLWVNLSPYEKDRITSDALSQTEMGRDLLAQDYILKKITASLLSPENETGRKFWEKVYSKMYEGQGATDIPVDAFHKIWIMPESAEVFAQNDTVLILNSKLKVMLEEDYFAKQQSELSLRGEAEAISDKVNFDEIASQKTLAMTEDVKRILREAIIPVIENEVNHGENFAALRQIFHGLILAKWFKDNLKTSLLGQVYADQSKLEGISTPEQKNIESIYNQYLAAFKSGSEGIIKEDYDPASQSVVAKKYVTGGFAVPAAFHAQETSNAMLSLKFLPEGTLQLVTSKIQVVTKNADVHVFNAFSALGGVQLGSYYFVGLGLISVTSYLLWMFAGQVYALLYSGSHSDADQAMMSVNARLMLFFSILLISFFAPSEQYIQDKAERQEQREVKRKARAFDERMGVFLEKSDFESALVQKMLDDFVTDEDDKYLLESAIEKDPGIINVLVEYSQKIDDFQNRLNRIIGNFEKILISLSRRIDVIGGEKHYFSTNAIFLKAWADVEALHKEWKMFEEEIRKLASSDPVYELVSYRIYDMDLTIQVSTAKHALYDLSVHHMVIEFNKKHNQAMMAEDYAMLNDDYYRDFMNSIRTLADLDDALGSVQDAFGKIEKGNRTLSGILGVFSLAAAVMPWAVFHSSVFWSTVIFLGTVFGSYFLFRLLQNFKKTDSMTITTSSLVLRLYQGQKRYTAYPKIEEAKRILQGLEEYKNNWSSIIDKLKQAKESPDYEAWVATLENDAKHKRDAPTEMRKPIDQMPLWAKDQVIKEFLTLDKVRIVSPERIMAGIQELDKNFDPIYYLTVDDINDVSTKKFPVRFLYLAGDLIGYAVKIDDGFRQRIAQYSDKFFYKNQSIRMVIHPGYNDREDLIAMLLKSVDEETLDLNVSLMEELLATLPSNTQSNQAMMSRFMAQFLFIANLSLAGFFVLPAAGFAQTWGGWVKMEIAKPKVPYEERNIDIQQRISYLITRPLTDYEKRFIGHWVMDEDYGLRQVWKLDGKGNEFDDEDFLRIVRGWHKEIRKGRNSTKKGEFWILSYAQILRGKNGVSAVVSLLPFEVPRADLGNGKEYGDLADVTTKGGIDLDMKDISFTSTGAVDQALLQQLPNIRPQDIIGVSITNITISPILSLPKLLGMDDSESDAPEESPAKMELSYLKEE